MTDDRREYMRLRDILRKRIDRLIKAGFGDTNFVKRNKGFYPSQGKLTDKQVKRELDRIKDALTYKGSTLAGARKIEKQRNEKIYQEYGIPANKMKAFGQFMETFRDIYGKHAYGSDEAAELFATLDEEGFTEEEILDNFKDFYEGGDDIIDMLKGGASSDDIREWLDL